MIQNEFELRDLYRKMERFYGIMRKSRGDNPGILWMPILRSGYRRLTEEEFFNFAKQGVVKDE